MQQWDNMLSLTASFGQMEQTHALMWLVILPAVANQLKLCVDTVKIALEKE